VLGFELKQVTSVKAMVVARYKPKRKRGGVGRPFPKGIKPEGAGRRKGSTNRIPRLLKDAILEAAEIEGFDGEGRDGLVGFLRAKSRTEPAAFLGLMGKVLPLQINAKVQAEMTVTGKFGNANIKSMTLEEKQAALAEILGLTRPLLPKPQDQVAPDQEVTEGEFSEVIKEAAE
jgi:hypothetical protein